MSNLYICIECEIAERDAEPAALNEHGLCHVCGSSSVVPIESFAAAQASASKREAPPVGAEKQRIAAWLRASQAKRSRDNDGLRAFLLRLAALAPNTKDAVTQWDGWAWHVYYPWNTDPSLPDENPAPGSFCIELISYDGTGVYIELNTLLRSSDKR